jgi:di/tricarboxylate transporter
MAETDELTFTVGIGIGVLLAVVGVLAYVLTDFASATALIPSIFGILFVFLGQLGNSAGRERVARYGLGVLALLGLGGSTRGIGDIVAIVTGGTADQPVAAGSQALMALCCLLLLGLVGWAIVEER